MIVPRAWRSSLREEGVVYLEKRRWILKFAIVVAGLLVFALLLGELRYIQKRRAYNVGNPEVLVELHYLMTPQTMHYGHYGPARLSVDNDEVMMLDIPLGTENPKGEAMDATFHLQLPQGNHNFAVGFPAILSPSKGCSKDTYIRTRQSGSRVNIVIDCVTSKEGPVIQFRTREANGGK